VQLFTVASRCRLRRVCKQWKRTLKVSSSIVNAIKTLDCTTSTTKNLAKLYEATLKYRVDLSGNAKLTVQDFVLVISQFAFKPQQIFELILSSTSPLMYSKILRSFCNITKLDLSFKTGKFFHDDDINIISRKLKVLTLEATDCVDDKMLIQFTGLEDLNLRSNTLITCESLSKLTKIQSLDLGNNGNISDNTLKQFTLLRSLGLDSNYDISDESVSILTNLTLLDLQYNERISDLTVSKLTNLVSLNLENNDCISKQIVSGLPRLKRLCLKHNPIISAEELTTVLKDWDGK